jgi:hypothetical protein
LPGSCVLSTSFQSGHDRQARGSDRSGGRSRCFHPLGAPFRPLVAILRHFRVPSLYVSLGHRSSDPGARKRPRPRARPLAAPDVGQGRHHRQGCIGCEILLFASPHFLVIAQARLSISLSPTFPKFSLPTLSVVGVSLSLSRLPAPPSSGLLHRHTPTPRGTLHVFVCPFRALSAPRSPFSLHPPPDITLVPPTHLNSAKTRDLGGDLGRLKSSHGTLR